MRGPFGLEIGFLQELGEVPHLACFVVGSCDQDGLALDVGAIDGRDVPDVASNVANKSAVLCITAIPHLDSFVFRTRQQPPGLISEVRHACDRLVMSSTPALE